MMPSVPQAVQSCHELLLWLILQLDKLPRVRRAVHRNVVELVAGKPSVHPVR